MALYDRTFIDDEGTVSTLAEIRDANGEDLDVVRVLVTLDPGESFTFGGGGSALVTLRRVS